MGVANCAEQDRHEPVCIHHSTLTTQHSNGTNTLEEYVYDYMGRRIAKETTTHATEDEEYRVFFYHGWNVAAEYTTDSSWANEDLDFTYTWGLDVSGSLQGAGGVGGLLVAEKVSTGDTGEYYPTYDGNGNVSEYIDSSGAQVAHYEYDPFGNELSLSSGTLKDLFTFKFSTKYEDKETGFYYYGYRYYDPIVGRWINRDPIGENGGINLYAFVENDGVNGSDLIGLIEIVKLKNKIDVGKGANTLVRGNIYYKTVAEEEGGEECCLKIEKIEWWVHATVPSKKFLKDAGFSSDLSRLEELLKKYPTYKKWYYAHKNNDLSDILNTAESVRAHEMEHVRQFESVKDAALTDVKKNYKAEKEKCYNSQKTARFWRDFYNEVDKGRSLSEFTKALNEKYPSKGGLPPGEWEAVQKEIEKLREMSKKQN